MKFENSNLNFTMKNLRQLGCLLLGLAWLPHASHAEIPEPDNLIYGVIQLGVMPVTGSDTNVVVEARRSSTNGPVVATYRMGESFIAGNFYSLRIPIEAFNPLTDTNASRVGGLLYLSVRDESGVRVRRTAGIAARGKLLRLDFTEPDSDGDGLSDSWEQQYFGSNTGANPNDDPDSDGRNNLAEYLAGTNPLVPDGRHPADRSPANNLLTFEESDAYANAWLAGTPWPNAPTNIPIAYVTKAAQLSSAGGAYVFTNTPATNAPHWWVNVPHTSALPPARTSTSTAAMPASALVQSIIAVTVTVTPAAGTIAHAVEEQIPAGWEILGASHGGAFDAANRKVKWGPFSDDGARDLTYDAVPQTNNATFTFVGTGSFDGVNVPVGGQRTIVIGAGGGPLRLEVSGRSSQGADFLLGGEANRTYVIEVSTNLTQWSPLQTISTDASGHNLFHPTNADQSPQRFYRVRTQ